MRSPPHDSAAKSGAPARVRLIGAATRLFRSYGAHAVGVEAIIAEADTAKATMYKVFGSKEGLLDVVLEREGAAWRLALRSAWREDGASARTQLTRIFPGLSAALAADAFFLKTLGAFERVDERFGKIARDHRAAMADMVGDIVDAAGARDAPALARQILVLMDGAIVGALQSDDGAAGQAAAEIFDVILPRALG